MPSSLEAPVLQVDANVIHKVDTANPANLFSMWTVFARCRDSVAQGRRLENLSWRLWNRETFCCEGEETIISHGATSKPRDIQFPRGAAADDVPQLSGSVDSVADEEAVDITSDSAPVDIVRPRIQRQDSCASSRSRGRERHITSDELGKMVLSIMEAKVPLDAPLPSIPRTPSAEANSILAPHFERTASTAVETTESRPPETVPLQQLAEQTPEPLPESQSRTIVTRGFSPSQVPVGRLTSEPLSSASPSAIPQPTDAPAPKVVLPKKQPPMFVFGGSSGSDEESFKNRSLEARKPAISQKSQSQKPEPEATAQKKTASFSNQLVTQTFNTSAISDTEDDYLDESAIDDDEDWEEESAFESGSSVAEEKLEFRRVDSTVNLPSRRSLITLMLAADNRGAQGLGGLGSQSTSALPRTRTALNGPSLVSSPNDSDEAPLMMKRGTTRPPPMRPINEVPRAGPRPINVSAPSLYNAASSPRTTRRNMLATELTESLRRNLLRERSHKSLTANAVLKRRHTANDVANLKKHPERLPLGAVDKEVDANPNNWDQYFQDPFGTQTQAW